MTRRLQSLNNWHIFYILVFVTIATSLWSAWINVEDISSTWWSGWLQNFSTEMMGAIATFVLFELVIEARKREEDKQDAIDREKRNLIIQMKTKDNPTALNAVAQLSANGWIRDGSLKGVELHFAHLEGAGLVNANLERADLYSANLQGANLQSANLAHTYLRLATLEGALLYSANLQGASLYDANLQGAKLSNAHLEGADLGKANLQGAVLIGAHLESADLWGANLQDVEWVNETGISPATLPDGTEFDDTDMERFTNYKHPEFNSTLKTINAIREKQGHRLLSLNFNQENTASGR